MDFNSDPPTIMHIDLNSCFATIEQQANPSLRGKPVAVAAYITPGGCILAASHEAKQMGVKTGMRVWEGRALCPKLVILPSDPEKYRFVNRALKSLLLQYSPILFVESIDEMVLDLNQTPVLEKEITVKNNNIAIQQYNNAANRITVEAMLCIGKEIKRRIKEEIGEWLTVSIGIAPNRYLAKVASGLHKPDGLDSIDKSNIEKILATLQLEDLTGIKKGYAGRLRSVGILTPLEFFYTDVLALKRAFRSIVGYDWWLRLHGYEKEESQKEDEQKTIGHSYALLQPYAPTDSRLHQILCQLVMKMGRRLRQADGAAYGMHVSCLYSDYSYWHHGHKYPAAVLTDRDCYERTLAILLSAPDKPVRILAVNTFALTHNVQESLFEQDKRKLQLTRAVDEIHNRWGDFIVTPARMLGMEPASTRRESGRVQRGEQKVLDRIAFGKV